MSDDNDIAKIVVAHGGWAATIVAGVGLWFLKKLFSAQLDVLIKVFEQMQVDINLLKTDVAEINGILRERDRNGRATWPGDSR